MHFGKTTLLLHAEWNMVGPDWKQGDHLRVSVHMRTDSGLEDLVITERDKV